MKKNQIIWLQVIYWSFNFFGTVVTPNIFFPEKNNLQDLMLEFSYFFVSISIFYLCYLVIIPKIFKPKNILSAVLVFAFSIFCFATIRYLIEESFFPAVFGFRNYAKETGLLYYLFDNIYNGCLTVFIAGILWLLEKFGIAENEKKKLELERNTAKLQALKTQINPHFIFNSLNNIYSLVYQKSDKALPAIEELSELLRYSTKDLQQDFISLKREVGYIESLIALEKLRIRNPEKIIFEKNIQNENLQISPMLLVPFVENAFKHGNFNEHEMKIDLKEENNILNFRIENQKRQGSKDHASGIGIANVKKRLELIYPNKHELNTSDKENFFVVELKIEL